MKNGSWIRNLFRHTVFQAAARLPSGAKVRDRRLWRPEIIVLEERALPSTYTVTNSGDAANIPGCLRYILDSQAHSGDTINFANPLNGGETIDLTPSLGPLTLPGLTITGTGVSSGLTINGGGSTLVFEIPYLYTDSISGLTITGGNGAGNPYAARGGGVYVGGTLNMTDCNITGNTESAGGGVGVYRGTLTMTGCTVSGNSGGSASSFGGGILNLDGTLNLIDCTVANNSVGTPGFGGGVATQQGGNTTITNCTISGNTASGGGGIYSSTATKLVNTIISGNTQGSSGQCYFFNGGSINSSSSNNLISDTSSGLTNGVNGNIIGHTALLDPLGSYGGPTKTMPELPGSPTINAGTSGTGIPTTDQRGLSRVGATDIGAVESQGYALAPATGSTPQSAQPGAGFANPLAVTVTPSYASDPVNGGVITFTAPTSGASATLSSASATIAGGSASVTATANSTSGSSTVSATASGVTAAASFSLNNVSLVVNNPTDTPVSGETDLRQAIASAESLSGNQTVTFASSVFGTTPQTITLSSGQLNLTKTSGSLTIQGPGVSLLSISGNNTSRVFYLDGGSATLSGLTVTGGKTSAGYGGGVYIKAGTGTLTNCIVSGNSAKFGGGLFNFGTATLTNCTVSINTVTREGAGVESVGTLALTNCTLSGNTASVAGGGIYNEYGTAMLTNCTISGNSGGTLGGGGIFNDSSMTLTNCTVTVNSANTSGGGIYNSGSGTTAVLANTIVAGNTNSSGPSDITNSSGAISGSYNLIGTGGSGGLSGGSNGNIVLTSLTNLALAPLGSYGGPTQTMPPLPGSPAINAGTSGTGIPTTDQRGLGRVGATDIGAVESQGYTLTASGTPQTTVIGAAFASPLAVAVTPNYVSDPVNGGIIAFTAPTTGASANLSTSSATIASGSASVTATANNTAGAYSVTAKASGVAAAASFSLDNQANLVVNNSTDTPVSGKLDLRQALTAAESLSGNQTITFDSTVFGSSQTIMLISGQLNLSKASGSLTVQGPGAGLLSISGSNSSRVFYLSSGAATLSGLTVTGGNAGNFSYGGGLENLSGTATLTNCTISGNSAENGGGLDNGGGVYTGRFDGTTTLTNCTVAGNSAIDQGGGLTNLGTTTLTNCTITGNTTEYSYGGGVAAQEGGSTTITNCTISANTASQGGGGIYDAESTGTKLTNTIVAGNTTSSAPSDIATPSGTISGSYNLIGTGGSGGLVNGSNGNIVLTSLTNLALAPPGSYGGPTQTMPPLPGSPAINAGTSGTGIPTTDQRGLGRVGATDIGAVESQGYTLAPATGSTPQTAQPGAAFANPLAVTVTPNYANDPINGGVITFTAPASGASATLSSASATIAAGSASVTATANTTGGAYTVTATATGIATAASFSLQNESTVEVNNPTDTPVAGKIDLRQALASAESLTGNQTVTFDPSVFGSTPQMITLASGQLNLSKSSGSVTIQGPGAGLLSINGNNGSSVFFMESSSATLSGLTITGGNAGSGYGGGLDNVEGTATLTDCTVSGNSASKGGGLYNYSGGTTTLTNCIITSNTASRNGGGLASRGTTMLTNCTITSNTSGSFGGGEENGGTSTLIDCSISGNTARFGGGLYNSSGATLTGCTFSGNSAIGASYRQGTGGGLSNQGSETLTNCTISGNSATGSGGGLATLGSAMLTNCTVSSNNGGGCYIYNSLATLTNTIVAGQISGGDISGSLAPASTNNLIGGNPLLAPLGKYGGPTQTMPPLPGSPAINAGTSGTGIPMTDQRGLGRVGATDIGAVESQGYTLAPATGSTPQTAQPGAVFANPLAVTVTPNYANDPVNGGVVTFSTSAPTVLNPIGTTGFTQDFIWGASGLTNPGAVNADDVFFANNIPGLTITSVSNTNPMVVDYTVVSNGLNMNTAPVTGQYVTIQGAQGNTAANGTWELTEDSFTTGGSGTITLQNSNGAAAGNYTGGGTLVVGGLPANGSINSAFIVGGASATGTYSSSGTTYSSQFTGVNFQLGGLTTPPTTPAGEDAMYSGNNDLLLKSAGAAGTLTLTTPGSYDNLAFLAMTRGGTSYYNFTLNFSDDSTLTVGGTAGVSVGDWFNTTNYAIDGLNRVTTGGSFDTSTSSTTNPRMYENDYVLPTADQLKTLDSITFTAVSTGTDLNIFAVSGTAAASSGASATLSSTTATIAAGSASVTAKANTKLGAYSVTATANGVAPGAFFSLANVDSTTVAVSSSQNPSGFGVLITFSAVVTPANGITGTPTGTATFYDGSAPLGTNPLVNGKATFSTSSLAVGTHSITAVYSGNASFLASTSSAINQVVNSSSGPSVGSVVINPGEGAAGTDTYLGNSRVLSIQVTFSTAVNTTSLQSAFSLKRAALANGVVGDNATVGTISVATNTNSSGDTVATLTFSGTNTEGSSLADGNWTLTINAADVTSGGTPMASNYTQTGILRLFGDYGATGTVDSTDLGALGTTFGLGSSNSSFLAAFDSDGNGTIDSTDLGRFGTNFGLTI